MLAGRYEVGELIGRGGMAEVYIGRDNRLSRRVAIKLLRSDLAQDSTFQARFRREAQSAAALNHPAIVSVYDTGEDGHVGADGVTHHLPFIVMEYVEGHTVRELIRDGAALPIDEAVEITAGVLSALEYSHHAGIVHRDIKPANVMITTAGDVKVMDFGIARAIADSAATMTQTQAVVGTAQYLSPEQARGEVVDARSDVYSTGALLFELLTGRPPFIGDSPVAVAYQHVREDPPTPSSLAPDVPVELDRITLKALAKDRDVRYQSGEEFRSDLEAAQRGGVVGAPAVGVIAAANAATVAAASPAARAAATQVMAGPPTAQTSSDLPPVAPEEEPRKGRAWIWVLGIVLALLVAGIVAVAVNNARQNEPEPTPTETTPENVAVPDVAGESEADAQATIEGAELVFARAEAPSDDVEAGLAISSDPAAGSLIAPGQTVTVTISSGPDTLTVPDVIGFTADQATTALNQAGFTGNQIRIMEEDDGSQQAGDVLRIEPGVGESAAPNAPFVLYVASGNVTIPDLTGRTQDEAAQLLRDANLSATFTQDETGSAAAGTVTGWEPTGVVPRLSTVTVSVASAQVEVPDLDDMTRAEAEAALAEVSLTASFQEEPNGDVEVGQVTRWEPENTQVDRGSEVTVWLATAPTETATTPPPTSTTSPPPTNGGGGRGDDD
ncbi:Stk1 family PASTA domain-containing Ser/Thr kinase [Litorihabitans aurantiacus]|uniref:Stk1 family PASTA domain-containing Ser/Thr kinase n=1 Tax=Litorihabitans aurantiacus TaxID=1930061 RepID=UPI0024E177FB|nr:Stk1 family PASTA domain-containing Ser/Thr kinase [Litorihabitans aurantiacus]